MLFENAEEYITCCNNITDNEVLEALDALANAKSLFEEQDVTKIPERINICLANGSVVYTIRNTAGTNDSYTCMPTPWYSPKSNVCLGIITVIAIGLVVKYIQ